MTQGGPGQPLIEVADAETNPAAATSSTSSLVLRIDGSSSPSSVPERSAMRTLEVASSPISFAADWLHYAIGEADGTVRLMEGGGQVAGWLSPNGSITSLSLSPRADRAAFATTGGSVGVIDFGGRVLWQKDLGTRAVIAFVGDKGDTVAGDWRGFVRRFDATGERLWEVDLTPQV